MLQRVCRLFASSTTRAASQRPERPLRALDVGLPVEPLILMTGKERVALFYS